MTDQERIAKHGINVLSFFDGISAGQEALRQLDVKVANYYAIEIEDSAIEVTNHNFPNTIQKGDILAWENKEREFINNLPEIDLVFAGSPCQGFSKAGNREGLDHELSRLFFNFHRILQAINRNRKRNRKPPVPFFFENVIMDEKADLDEDCDRNRITKYLGVGQPYRIDAKDYSPCARDRYYWTNMSIPESIMRKYKDSRVYQDIIITKKPSLNRLTYKPFFSNIKAPDAVNRFNFKTTARSLSLGCLYHENSQGYRVSKMNTKMPTITKTGRSLNNGLGVFAFPLSNFSKKESKAIEQSRDASNRLPLIIDVPKNIAKTHKIESGRYAAFHVDVREALMAMGFPMKYYDGVSIKDSEKIAGIGNSWSVTIVKLMIDYYCTQMGWVGLRSRI